MVLRDTKRWSESRGGSLLLESPKESCLTQSEAAECAEFLRGNSCAKHYGLQTMHGTDVEVFRSVMSEPHR